MVGVNRNVIIKDLQSGRFLCLIVMLILGSFSITTTSLLVRSEKKTEIEEVLTITGDYDEIIYNTDIGFENTLSDIENIDDIGLYYELGSVSNVDETESFKAVSLKDELSEDIYHMICIRGTYPKNENEIAIDISVANKYGIAPYPGETLNLKLYNSKGIYINTKEFIVSGVFRCSSNEMVGGWYRCPNFARDNNSYQMPAVFFYSSDLDIWECNKETVFFRAPTYGASELVNKTEQLLKETEQVCLGFEYNNRRYSGYSWCLGLGHINLGDLSWENINKEIRDGLYKRDFYSAIIFPIISILVIITEAISLFMLSKNIIADRKEYYATLRSIGMSSKRVVRNLLLEIFGFGIGATIIGIGLGYWVHLLLVRELNDKLHLRIYDGIYVSQAIKQITFDPLVFSLLVCICSLVLSLSIPLFRLYKMYPAELLSASKSVFVEASKSNKQEKSVLKCRWIRLLNKRIDLHDGSTMVVMLIILSSCLFGYVFFRAFSEQATVDSRGFLNMLGIDGDGYVATRSSELQDWGYNVSNRHDAGIKPSFPEQLENNPNVDKTWSVIFNESTRMVYKDEPEENIKLLLGNRLLNYRQSNDPFIVDSIVAEDIIFEHMGYEANVYMYELPTVGLTTNEMLDLKGEVIAGQINIDRIKNGEEVVLAVPPELQDLCLQYFPVGSSLKFDDVLLSAEEEKLNFHTLDDAKWVVYDNYIETATDETYVSYGAFGKQYSIETKVGAIVVLHDEKDIAEYLTEGSNWVKQLHYLAGKTAVDPEPSYGMSIICLADSFEHWGLPDKNFTSVKAELKDGCDIYEFDEFWYKGLSGSLDVQTRSTYDYLDDISIKTNRVMTIFCVMIITLIFLSMMSIISGLYTKIRSNTARLQALRRIGLSINQASIMIYTQNMFYPIAASLGAIIPVLLTQSFFKSMLNKLKTGVVDISETPWYVRMPWGADLFSYDFIPALLCCLLLGFLLIFIGTLPQILYLRKMKMIETRED